MYLRKNRIGNDKSGKTYVAIAHSVWHRIAGKKPHSRPLIIANLGSTDEIDLDLAHQLAVALDQLILPACRQHSDAQAAIRRAVAEIRNIQPFLRLLVRREGGLASQIPEGPHRATILADLIQSRLSGRVDDIGSPPTPSASSGSPLEVD